MVPRLRTVLHVAGPDLRGTSRWTSAAGTRWHSRHWGAPDQPLVVLVAGLGASGRYLSPLAVQLARRGLQVAAPDWPGHGRTPAPSAEVLSTPRAGTKQPDTQQPGDQQPTGVLDGMAAALGQWLTATGVRPAAIVANSMGCQVLVRLAARDPDLTDLVVLQGPTLDPSSRTYPRLVLAELRAGLHERPSLIPVLLSDWATCGPRRLHREAVACFEDRPERLLPQVRQRTLVVRSAGDPPVPQAWAEQVTALLPHARLEVVERGGHGMVWTRPDVLADLVRREVPA